MEPVIKWTKKNMFWLGCTFLTLAMLGVWFYASGAVKEETDGFVRNVKQNITTAQGILGKSASELDDGEKVHPNATSEQGMREELSRTIDSIVDAWRFHEEAQQEILVWPKVIPNEKFEKTFGQFNPAEKFPEKWEKGYGFESLLVLYASRIREQMDFLCGDEVLRTYWKYDPANMTERQLASKQNSDDEESGRFGGGGASTRGSGTRNDMLDSTGKSIDKNKYAVVWSDVNQDLWYQKLTKFQGRDDNDREINAPTPLQCYMLQQDLWLLEAMFRIIREVNGNSNANDLSAVKIIDHVVFGREVGGRLGELTAPDIRLAGSLDGENPLVTEADDPRGGAPSREDDREDDIFGLGTGNSNLVVPYDKRYVDTNFEPLSAEVVRAVITGTELPEENLELIVAKRVPVRIAVRMDERRIADFMAACANSPFAFEIQQVRWNKHTPGGELIPLGGSTTSGGSGSRDSMTVGNMMTGVGAGSLDIFKVESAPVETRTNYDVNVEFYGIVKIYNPVRENFLRKAAGLDEKDRVNPGDAASLTNLTGGNAISAR